jgi:putative acetyltransferase
MISKDHLVIRSEVISGDDRPGVRAVNEAAFGRADEANLVDALRAEGVVLASLVAEMRESAEGGERVVGHILFSRMWIQSAKGSISAVALAPVAVLPKYQCLGIGGRLIRDGLNLLHESGERIVIVVGHPDYYPRFGFSLEKTRTIRSPFPVDAFMAIELRPDALAGVEGEVQYPASFGL